MPAARRHFHRLISAAINERMASQADFGAALQCQS